MLHKHTQTHECGVRLGDVGGQHKRVIGQDAVERASHGFGRTLEVPNDLLQRDLRAFSRQDTLEVARDRLHQVIERPIGSTSAVVVVVDLMPRGLNRDRLHVGASIIAAGPWDTDRGSQVAVRDIGILDRLTLGTAEIIPQCPHDDRKRRQVAAFPVLGVVEKDAGRQAIVAKEPAGRRQEPLADPDRHRNRADARDGIPGRLSGLGYRVNSIRQNIIKF